jgi:phage tail sheath protein FI
MASKQSAVYFPWVNVIDGDGRRSVSPSAFAAGIYSRVDNDRGVHKAPANEPVRLAASLAYTLNDSEQEELNQNGVNCLRDFSDTGIRVWGARTTVSQIDPQWRYINVRRLFNMIEKSLEMGTKWAVFEPNDSKLWGALTRNTKAFLGRVYGTGAFAGNSEAEAFYVICDSSNNPQDNIDAGIVTIEIGIAPVKPAEFIVFKISQTSPGGAA